MQIHRTVVLSLSFTLFISWGVVSFPTSGFAQEVQRFVSPQQAKVFTEPQSKAQIKVLIDEHLGGTKDVTIAELT